MLLGYRLIVLLFVCLICLVLVFGFNDSAVLCFDTCVVVFAVVKVAGFVGLVAVLLVLGWVCIGWLFGVCDWFC